MYIEQRGKFIVEVFENLSEFKEKFAANSKINIVEIKSNDPFELQEDNIYWGSKLISWQKKITENFYSDMQQTAAKKIKKALNRCLKENIEIKEYDQIPVEVYLKWFNELYKPLMKSKSQEPYIDSEWINTDSGLKHKGIFYYCNNELIGGNLYKIKENKDLSFSYKANKYNLQFDLNVLMEYTSYRKAKDIGSEFIRKGIDYNLYGANLSLGLMEYKQKFGYKPINYISGKDKNLSYFRYIIIVNNKGFEENTITFISENSERLEPLLQVIKLNTELDKYENN